MQFHHSCNLLSEHYPSIKHIPTTGWAERLYHQNESCQKHIRIMRNYGSLKCFCLTRKPAHIQRLWHHAADGPYRHLMTAQLAPRGCTVFSSAQSELLFLQCPLVMLATGLHGNVSSNDRFPLEQWLHKARICIFSLSSSTRCLVIIFLQWDGVISHPSLSTSLSPHHRGVYRSGGCLTGQCTIAIASF